MQTTDHAGAAREAVEKAGGAAVIAKALGVSLPAITQWKRRGIPADRVLAVEGLSGVSRHQLRPDIFGAEHTAALHLTKSQARVNRDGSDMAA